MARMNILLTQRLAAFQPFAGETKFNRDLLEALAERGHACRMIALAMPHERRGALAELREGRKRGRPPDRSSDVADVYVEREVEYHVVENGQDLIAHLT